MPTGNEARGFRHAYGSMSLCPSCKRVGVGNLTCKLDDLPSWWEQVSSRSTPRGMVHLHDARDLLASASACPLCGLILDALLQDLHGSDQPSTGVRGSNSSREQAIHQLRDELAEQPIYLRPNYDLVKPSFPENGVEGAWHVRGFKAFVPVDDGIILTGAIRLFAAGDSPAGSSCHIIGRPPLSSSDSPEAFNLIERWMSTCLAKHDICRTTLSGHLVDESTPPVLPTRVVYVGRPDGAVSPRLLETQGRRGHYLALSHCWGPATLRPLMTTQSCLADHVTSIPWHAMHKSYQDAIAATHRLAFEYIWIDSLCIIQDSHTDWLSESQRMGDVYQHARLTIAASHAADSSQPCFFTRPSPRPVVELPHINVAGAIDGSIFASLMPADYVAISPESGALAYRAWATQEWLLSRRMVFYTADCLVWSCKAVSQRETGASFHVTARNSRWKAIIEKYSARGLTQQTDRLIALDGVRFALAKTRQNDTYCYGLWKNSMPDQLLWYCVEPAQRNRCELQSPTWTWASSLHGVRFLGIKGAKNACRGFRFDEATSTLTIRGVVRKIARVLPHAERLFSAPSEFASSLSDTILPETAAGMTCSLETDNGRVIGWGVLDEGTLAHTQVHCLRLMSKGTRFKASAKPIMAYEDWVLLLRGTDDAIDEYTRCGVGKLTTSTNIFADKPMTNNQIY